MNSELVRRALAIADGAIELQGEERARFVHQACAGEVELQTEVESILDYDSNSPIIEDFSIAAESPSAELPELPPICDRYVIRDELFRGGMGIVYSGYDSQLDREVAVKVLQDRFLRNPGVLRQFLNEAKICGQLQHPGVPPVYEFGCLDGGRPFLAMKLVRGETLAATLSRMGPAPERSRLLAIFEQICHAVAYAHSRNIIHRDLKPENVMVNEFGDVQVVDWGLAKVLTDESAESDVEVIDGNASADSGAFLARTAKSGSGLTTGNGMVMGTPAYMAPEQSRGAGAATTDVFQLGGILCEILTGSPPYHADNPLVVFAMASHGELEGAFQRLDLAEADAELIEITKKCLNPSPSARFMDAGELANHFVAYMSTVQTRLRDAEIATARAETRLTEERKRRRLAIALCIATFLTIVSGLGGWSWSTLQRARHAEDLAVIEREQNIRRSRIEANFDASLLKAYRVLERAIAAPLTDMDAWNHARSELARVESIVHAGHGIEDFKSELGDLQEAFRASEQELQVALAISRARDAVFEDPEFAPWGNTQPKLTTVDRVLSDNGFHPDSRKDEPIVIERMRALSPVIKEQLIGAVDQWMLVCDEKHRDEMLFMLEQVDHVDWRKQWRTAYCNENQAELARLFHLPEAERQSTRSLINLVRSVEDHVDENTRIEFLTRQYSDHADNVWYNYLLADLLRASNRVGEAIQFYQAGLTALPNHRMHAFLAHAHSQQKEYSESISCLRQATRLRPDVQNYWNLLGHDLVRSHRYEEAVEVCREAIRINVDNPYPQLVLGVSLSEIGHLGEAIDTLRNLITVDHRFYSVQARLILTESLRKNEQYLDSLRVFENVQAFSKNPVFAYHIEEQTFLMAAVALKVANRETEDSKAISADETSYWRERARVWLLFYLDQDRCYHEHLWATDPQFASVRSDKELAILPEEQRERWRDFWKQVQAVAGTPTGINQLETASMASDWELVEPLQCNSISGAQLIRQADGSFLVQGTNQPYDVYSIRFHSDLELVSGLKLEIIADERLPNGGPGRHESGNFQLGEIALEMAAEGPGSHPVHVPFARCWADYSWGDLPITRSCDGNLNTAWHVAGAQGKSHVAVFVLKQPLVLSDQPYLTLQLRHGGDLGQAIGRFRVSITNQPFATTLRLPILIMEE